MSFENWNDEHLSADMEVSFKYNAGGKWLNPSLKIEPHDYDEMCFRNAYTGALIMRITSPQINDFKDFPSAVTDIENDTAIRISDNILRLDVPTRIRIFSAEGSTVADFTGTEYDFSSLPPGIYIVHVTGKTLKVKI